MNAHDWPPLDGFTRENSLEMFTVYDRPLDYPGHYVVRRWFAQAGKLTADVVPRLASSLDEARAMVPPYLHRLPRGEGDDAFVVEVWC